MTTITATRAAAFPLTRSTTPHSAGEDRQLLVAAATLTRDLGRAKPWIYWTDLIATSLVAYLAFAFAVALPFGGAGLLAAVVSMLAFYRGISFIHELTHIKAGSLPGFKAAWNVLIGIPLLTPSFMYDDVHVIHHSKASYGTSRDPEYLPLASMRPLAVVLFIAVSALAPLGLIVRFAVLGPLSLASPRLRRLSIGRFSSLAINPAFRRRTPTGAFRREWMVLEPLTCVWAVTIVGLIVTGGVGLRSAIAGFTIGSGVALINQVRTLAAHLWENESGEPMSLTAQYLDSVNVPPPATLPAIWAPVGLRYHGLHHLLPSIPYHALSEAHRRLKAHFGTASTFSAADHESLSVLLRSHIPSRSADRRCA